MSKQSENVHHQFDADGRHLYSIDASAPLVMDYSFPTRAQEVLRIAHDGRIYWKGREVESDDDFRAAMMDLAQWFKGRP